MMGEETYTRAMDVDAGSVDIERGTFRAVLLTGGEAADGHRVNVRGVEFPDQIPLFLNHQHDPVSQLGSLRAAGIEGEELVVNGQILTDGEGVQADVRRDILHKMAAGHVRSFSGTWVPTSRSAVKSRRGLPADHPAHVTRETAEEHPARARGLYFEASRALEGSIVGIGSDSAATLREWAETAEDDAVGAFYRSLVDGTQEPAPEPPARDTLLELFATTCRELESRDDVSHDDLVAALESTAPTVEQRLERMERQIAGLMQAQESRAVQAMPEEPDGEPPAEVPNVRDFVRTHHDETANSGARMRQTIEDYIHIRRGGRVSDLPEERQERVSALIQARQARRSASNE